MGRTDFTRLVALGAIWGASFAFMRVAVPAFGPSALIAVRLALAAAFLLVVAAVLRRRVRVEGRVGHYAIVGLVNSAVPFFCFAYAAQSLPAGVLAVFNSLAPVFGAVTAWLWLGAPMTRATQLGLALGVVGVGLLARDSIAGATVVASTSQTLLSLAVLLVAPICYGLAATYLKWRASDVTPFENAVGAMVGAALMTAPLAAVLPPAAMPTAVPWVAASVLGLLCTGFAYILSFRLIADLGPTRALTVTFLVPAFGVLWGILFLHEPLTIGFAAGGALIVLGTMLSNGLVKLPGVR